MHQHGDCVATEDYGNGLTAASAADIPAVITRSVYFRDDDFSEALIAVDDLTALFGVWAETRALPHCTNRTG